MQTIGEIRLENLHRLITEFGSQERVATLAETNPVYLSQLVNQTPDSKTGRPRDIGTDLARKLEKGCGKEIGWMDNVAPPADGRRAQLAAALAVMEAMPEYQLDKALKILDALAEPPQRNGTIG